MKKRYFGRNFGQDASTGAVIPAPQSSLSPAQNLNSQLIGLQNQISTMSQVLDQWEKDVQDKEAQLMYGKSTTLPFYLAPGYLRDMNLLSWPYIFETTRADVAPGPAAPVASNFSVNSDAAFIITAMMKTIFLKTSGPFNVQYMDPDAPAGAGKATGLTVSMQDGSSSRSFMFEPIDMDHIGNPLYPTKLTPPMIIMPSATLKLQYQNTSLNEYVVFMSFLGIRVRLEDIDAAMQAAGMVADNQTYTG